MREVAMRSVSMPRGRPRLRVELLAAGLAGIAAPIAAGRCRQRRALRRRLWRWWNCWGPLFVIAAALGAIAGVALRCLTG
jgi:hypothetical protein